MLHQPLASEEEMAQEAAGVGHWPGMVAHDGREVTFLGVAKAERALSSWAGDHRQLGRQGLHPCTGRQAAHEGQGEACHEEELRQDREAEGPRKEMEGEEGEGKV